MQPARYGDTVPVSEYGKIVTMIYAILGIPVYILYFRNIGKVLQSLRIIHIHVTKAVSKGFCKYFQVDLPEHSQMDWWTSEEKQGNLDKCRSGIF